MSFHFRCPFCNAKLEAEDEWEGSETTCPKCTHEIGIEREPEFEPEPPAPPVNNSKQTKGIPKSTSSVEKRARLPLNLYLPGLKVRLLLNLFHLPIPQKQPRAQISLKKTEKRKIGFSITVHSA